MGEASGGGESPVEDDALAWREQIVRVLLLVAVGLALLTFLFFVRSFVERGVYGPFVSTAVSCTVLTWIAVSKRVPYGVKVGLLLFSMYTAGAAAFLVGGDRAGGMANMVAVVALAALLVNYGVGIAAMALTAASLVVFGFGYRDGWLPLPGLIPFEERNLMAWVGTAVWTSGAVSVVFATMYALDRRVQQTIAARNDLVAKLSTESEARAQALVELENAQNQLLRAERMETVGRLAGGLAHDMNNALTVILAEADMLPASQQEPASHILHAAEAASQLTRQLLSFGRRDVVRPRTIDLVDAVRRASRGVTRTLPSDIEFSLDLCDGRVWVMADPMQVQHVVFNLVLNARDAMTGPDGGHIEVSVSTEDDGGALRVRDDGSGMDEATLSRIFEPFFTTKDAARGTGLGLANVRHIVEGLGGTVDVRSRLGEGTTFLIRFPSADSPPADAKGNAATVPGGDGRKILVVDDDIRIRAVVCTALESAGYSVFEAAEPGAAIDLLSQSDRPFDLVWTDVVMPHGGAPRLLQWLESHQPDTAVLICSAYTNDEAVRRGVEAGRYAHLAKPFTRTKALEACAEVLDMNERGGDGAIAHDVGSSGT